MTAQLSSLWTRLQALVMAPPVQPEQLASEDPSVRWRAARRLAGRPRADCLPGILDLLDDPDPIIRDESARTLASWGPSYALASARAGLESRPSPALAVSLLDLLATMPDPGNKEVIAPYLSHSDPLVRGAAAHAAGALGVQQDYRAVLPLLSDGDPRVRRAGCTALGQVTDPGSLPGLRQCLNDKDELTRTASKRAIAQIEAAETSRQTRRQPDQAPAPTQ